MNAIDKWLKENLEFKNWKGPYISDPELKQGEIGSIYSKTFGS